MTNLRMIFTSIENISSTYTGLDLEGYIRTQENSHTNLTFSSADTTEEIILPLTRGTLLQMGFISTDIMTVDEKGFVCSKKDESKTINEFLENCLEKPFYVNATDTDVEIYPSDH